MAEPVELRIHGVGGSTPEGLLGERHPDDVVELKRGHRTGLWARRRDPSVRGYVWGGLTSGARLQPLWIVLLPFTLVNVAGWMHPPLDGTPKRRRRINDIRRLVTLLGLTLTVTWAVWLAITVGDFLAYQGARGREALETTPMLWGIAAGTAIAIAGLAWRRWAPLIGLGALVAVASVGARFVDRPTVRAVGGVIAGQAVLGVLIYIAGISRRRYERFLGPSEAHAAPRRMTSNEDLRSPVFFSRPDEGKRLLVEHVAVLAVVTVLLCARAYVRAQDGAAALDFGSWLMALNAVQFVLLIALAVRSFDQWSERRRRWRFAGPAAAAGLGLLLTNAVFTGLAQWSSRRVKGVRTGAERAFADMYVLDVVLVFLLLLLAWLPYFLSGRPPTPAGEEADPDELTWHRSRFRRQLLARAFRHIDLLVTAAVAWLVIAGLVATLTRIDFDGSLAPWGWSIDHDGGLSPIRGAGTWILPFLVPAVGVIIRAGVRSTGARRNIGNLWDVAGLWPRRFHPLAVRPYAERAVPELQAHIHHVLATESRPLVISAHSQGTVLAFVALSGIALDEDLTRVALVTYGSPLSRLHARFFPAYVGARDLDWLRTQLHSWRSFFHRTDHIGQTVFDEVPDADVDVELPDPAEGPVETAAAATDGPPFLEPDRTPWRAIAGHNDYLREPALKAWVATVKAELRA
ncbi:MAG: hypothetical protein ACRD2W_13565 [Acidimicrobiales bacterium]